MITLMTYFLLVSGAVAAAAIMGERALAALGLPTRGVWVAALLASVVVPVVPLQLDAPAAVSLIAESPASAEESVVAPRSDAGEAVALSSGRSVFDWPQWGEWASWSGWQSLVESRPGLVTHALDDVLVALWITASALVLLAHFAASFGLRRALARLPAACIDGTDVTVSTTLGPAVFGVRAPRIVVPSWLLDAPLRTQAVIVRHERSHVAARDTWWLNGAVLAVALVPWNPLMWWQLRRLRAAVELDCDARVTASGTAPTAYARVLLAVAERRVALSRPVQMLGAVGWTGRKSQLERRVARLLERPRSNRVGAVLCGTGAAMAFAAAFALQPPETPLDAAATQPSTTRPLERDVMTGLTFDGERVVLLVDVSQGVLDRTAEGIARRIAGSPEERRQAPEWRHLVETVESLLLRIPSGASFQLILFDEDARAALPGTDGQWLPATADSLRQAVDALRDSVVPDGRSDLAAAFAEVRALQPPPDLIHLVVDGLPTTGSGSGGGEPADERERMAQLDAALESGPAAAPINVILMPNEEDVVAAAAYWWLAHHTGGGLYAPVEGSMRGSVPGVPLDSEYLVFIVDTSGSMRMYAGDTVRRQIRATLDAHPSVRGFQVMNDTGAYLFEDRRGEWLPDTPDTRFAILDALGDWDGFSTSTPREGVVAAIEALHDPAKRTAFYVFGDDLAKDSLDDALESIEAANLDPETGTAKVRINAVALPVYLEVTDGELLSAANYAVLMRRLALKSGGAFVALTTLAAAP